MKIGVIGAGHIGKALARHFVALGHEVTLANSRGVDAVRPIAEALGAKPATAAEAARAGEVVVVTIPEKAIPSLGKALFAGVAEDVVVIDTGNYYPGLRDGRISAIDDGLCDSEWVARELGRPVVKAFNNIYALSLEQKGKPKGASGRVALCAAGDPPAARAKVLALIDAIGFDPVDAGSLADSWRQQVGTPAYCKDLSADGLRAALAAADKARVAEYRAEGDAAAQRAFG